MANTIKTFETTKKYVNKHNEEITVYKGITFDEIVEWLTNNGTDEDRHCFKVALYSTKDGKETSKPNFINAKRVFFERHNPSYLVSKKSNKAALVANW